MIRSIQYRPLFTVRIIHEYYLPEEADLYPDAATRMALLDEQERMYNIHTDLTIVPTEDTLQIMKDYRLKFKRNNFGFFVGSQVETLPGGGFRPFMDFNEPLLLRFGIFQNNLFFFNYTNLRLEKSASIKERTLYHFSNRVANTIGGNFLSRSIAGFDSTTMYEAGALIAENFNTQIHLLEAIEDNTVAPNFNLVVGVVTVDPPWRIIYPNQATLPQFVTFNDKVALRPKFFQHDVESAALEAVEVLVRDITGTLVRTISCVSTQAGVTLQTCPLDLTTLPSGLYELEVQDTFGTILPNLGLRFYLDNKMTYQRPLAVIECFHEPDGSLGAYRWIDENNNQILDPVYTIRWKNRSTFWRYHFAENQAPTLTNAVTDDVETFEITPDTFLNDILISEEPLSLTQFGRRVEINEDGDIILLPNPEINAIFPENGRVYSEINMGGGLGPP